MTQAEHLKLEVAKFVKAGEAKTQADDQADFDHELTHLLNEASDSLIEATEYLNKFLIAASRRKSCYTMTEWQSIMAKTQETLNSTRMIGDIMRGKVK